MSLDYKNKLEEGYMLPQTPRLFANAAAYLLDQETENELLGNETQKPENPLIDFNLDFEDVEIRNIVENALAYFPASLQTLIKDCFTYERKDFELIARGAALKRDELLDNSYFPIAIVENKTKIGLHDDIHLTNLCGVTAFIEKFRIDRRFVEKGVYSTVHCQGEIAILYPLYDPKIHVLKRIMLMKCGTNQFARLAAIKNKMREEMKDFFKNDYVTDVDLHENFESYCSENGKHDLYNDLNKQMEKIMKERFNYLVMTGYSHTSQELKFFFKEVKTSVKDKNWLSFENTGIKTKCALFEYLWFYGALPVKPLTDPARVFFKRDGYYVSKKTKMRDDGTIYFGYSSDEIVYRLEGGRLVRE